jgi:hypothetical protein
VSLVPYRDEIEAQRDRCHDQAQTLCETKATLIRKIEQIHNDVIAQIETEIAADYQAMFAAIPSFARNHWEKDPLSQQQAWKKVECKIRIPEKIQATKKLLSEDYTRKLEDILKEIDQDLAFIESFKATSRDRASGFTGKDAGFDFHFFTKLGGILATVAGIIMSLMSGLGFAAGITTFVGAGLGMSSQMSKKKQQRQAETCKKIEEALRSEVRQKEHASISNLKRYFKGIFDSVIHKANKYFDAVVTEFDSAKLSLNTTSSNLKTPIQTLDRSISLRIHDWCNQNREPLDQTRLDRTIQAVQRNPGKLQIQLTQNITQPPAKQRQTECSQILGVDVQFSK